MEPVYCAIVALRRDSTRVYRPEVEQAPDLLPASSFRPDVGLLEGPAGGGHGVGRRQRFHLQSQMQGEAVVAAVEIAVRELLDAFEALVARCSMDAE